MFTKKKPVVQPSSLELISQFNLDGSGAIDWVEETHTLSLFGNACFSYEQRSFLSEKFACICADLETKCLRLMLNDGENQAYTQHIITGCLAHSVNIYVFLNNIDLNQAGLKNITDSVNKCKNRIIHFDFRSVQTNTLIYSLRDCINLRMSVTIDNIIPFLKQKGVSVIVRSVNVVELNLTITDKVSDSDLSDILDRVNSDTTNIKRLKITSVSKRDNIAPIVAFLKSGRCNSMSFGYLSTYTDVTQTKELLDTVANTKLEEFLYYDGVKKRICIWSKESV